MVERDRGCVLRCGEYKYVLDRIGAFWSTRPPQRDMVYDPLVGVGFRRVGV